MLNASIAAAASGLGLFLCYKYVIARNLTPDTMIKLYFSAVIVTSLGFIGLYAALRENSSFQENFFSARSVMKQG